MRPPGATKHTLLLINDAGLHVLEIKRSVKMIKIEGLVKNYGINTVLRGVNLRVQPGEFVSLVGSNGAGKTTLLRIVATLLKPNGGQVTIGGWPLPDHADKVRHHIGMVSHQALLYGHGTRCGGRARYYTHRRG